MAGGLGVFAAILDRPLSRAMVAGMAIWFFFWTTSMIAVTTRFLYGHAREQAEAAERARGEATESQLAALQAQMNPHFLFNTLNTVASLVRTDAAAAEATVENLAVVLRRTLDRSRRVVSTVDDEIDHLAAYISVAKQRFEDRLQVQWSVDPSARDVLLPTMTLQPLVENALKHGIGARLEGGALHIGVQLEEGPRSAAEASTPTGDGHDGFASGAGGQRLILEVADDGPGFPRKHREGTGLSNLRARLVTLYGEAAELVIDRGAPGSRVVVSVPALRSTDDAAGFIGELADPRAAAVTAE
jgi:two-component system LytT family sensor kinase